MGAEAMTDRVISDLPEYARMPHWIIESDLSDGAMRLLLGLLTFDKKGTRECFPSRETLAEVIGKSEDTVDNRMKELVDARLVTIEKRRNPKTGHQTSSTYFLHLIQSRGSSAPQSRGSSGSRAEDLRPEVEQVGSRETSTEVEVAEQAKRDLVFEAVCYVCGIDWEKGLTKTERGLVGRATKELKSVEASADEIVGAAAAMTAAWDGKDITPTALMKHFSSYRNGRPSATQRQAAVRQAENAQIVADVFADKEGQ